jgi:hypothetical protein
MVRLVVEYEFVFRPVLVESRRFERFHSVNLVCFAEDFVEADHRRSHAARSL